MVYGVIGYKVHAKMLMVVRREEHGLRRYVHLGTGNYHPRTARLYTDFGLLTCNEQIASDVNDIFVQLTGLGRASQLKLLFQSPFTLHSMVMEAIDREIAHAQAGKPAQIIAKMNALLESQVIHALYRASQAGVKIQLIVRGVCALRPGVPGLSDNISVRSIVGRFLEHPRVFYFHNDRKEDLLIASADWMGRNFFRRIETCVPIVDAKLKRRVIKEALRLYLDDNVNAWDMLPDGSYKRRTSAASRIARNCSYWKSTPADTRPAACAGALPARTTMEIAGYSLAALLVIAGLAGTMLPIIPGLPLMFGGLLLAAWLDNFNHLGAISLIIMALLTALGLVIDFFAGLLGAKASGASSQALWGAFIGGIVGMFFGLAGVLLGPLVGAIIGEFIARKDAFQAGKVGIGTFIGFIVGAVAKVACAFAMLATAALALLF